MLTFYMTSCLVVQLQAIDGKPKHASAPDILAASWFAVLDRGKATVHERGTAQFDTLMASAFPGASAATATNTSEENNSGTTNASSFAAGARSIVVADIHHVASACGYGVPLMEFKSDRDSWVSWAGSKDESAMQQYRIEHNAASLDGLDALQAAIDAAKRAAKGSEKGAVAQITAGSSTKGSGSCCMIGMLQKVVGEAAAGPLVWLSVGLLVGALVGAHAARR
jgi:hypothetical protein